MLVFKGATLQINTDTYICMYISTQHTSGHPNGWRQCNTSDHPKFLSMSCKHIVLSSLNTAADHRTKNAI